MSNLQERSYTHILNERAYKINKYAKNKQKRGAYFAKEINSQGEYKVKI